MSTPKELYEEYKYVIKLVMGRKYRGDLDGYQEDFYALACLTLWERCQDIPDNLNCSVGTYLKKQVQYAIAENYSYYTTGINRDKFHSLMKLRGEAPSHTHVDNTINPDSSPLEDVLLQYNMLNTENPEKILMRKQKGEMVQKALKKCTPKQREALSDVFWSGKGKAEMARWAGVHEASMADRVSQGLKNCKKFLSEVYA